MQKTSALAAYANFTKRAAEGDYENKPDDREYVSQEDLQHPATRGVGKGFSLGGGIGSVAGALGGAALGLKHLNSPSWEPWNVTKYPLLNAALTGAAYPAVGGIAGELLGSGIGAGVGALTGAGKKTREEWHGKMKDYRENPEKYYFEPKEAAAMQKTSALAAYANFMKRAAEEEEEPHKWHPAIRKSLKGLLIGTGIGAGAGGLSGAGLGAGLGSDLSDFGLGDATVPAALFGGAYGSGVGAGLGGLLGGGIGALRGKREGAEWKEKRTAWDKAHPKTASEAYVNFVKSARERPLDTMHPALRGMRKGMVRGAGIGGGIGGALGLARAADVSGGKMPESIAGMLFGAGAGALTGGGIGGGLGALTRKSRRDKWHAAMKAQGK